VRRRETTRATPFSGWPFLFLALLLPVVPGNSCLVVAVRQENLTWPLFSFWWKICCTPYAMPWAVSTSTIPWLTASVCSIERDA
jgi:hypothetical protein